MTHNTKCIKINNDILTKLKEDFKENIKIYDIQTYFPILSLFFEFYNDSETSFILNSNFIVKSLLEPIEQIKSDSYIKHFFKASILNQNNNETIEQNIFVKILPLINISQAMMNEYNLDNNNRLPNIHASLTSKKINNYNNSAYIDSFFSYLGSKLTENGKCPSFPLFFGTFTGVADEFKYDITEEYSSIKRTSWYKKYNNTKFTIQNVDLERPESPESQENDSLKKIVNIDDECQDINNILNNDEFLEISKTDIVLEEPNSSVEEPNSSVEEPNSDESGTDESESTGSDISINLCKLDSISLNSDSDLSLSSCDMYEINYCCIKDYPVQINCIEMLNGTLDNYIEKIDNNIPETEWKSILFQVCFGLAVAQKQYDFVHNDLHSSNIMFKETELEYLYYNFKGTYFKIPTFGKISKIIDFGRATFNYKNKLFFSDVFKKNGEAEGQYNYPYLNNLDKCKIKPNKSFDLSRLATTIIEHFEEDSDIFRLLKLWCSDKYGNFLMELNDDFNLYKIIAKNVKSAVPKNQINKLIFKEFIVEKDSINANEYIYNY
jgi:hypothetical protein